MAKKLKTICGDLGYLHNQIGVTIDALQIKHDPLEWQKKGIQFTASGYGGRIPTANKVFAWGRWYRIYCAIWGNIGVCFIESNGYRFFLPDSVSANVATGGDNATKQ